MNLGFVISATAVAAKSNFNLMKDTIGKLIEKHGTTRINYGIIVFGDKPSIRLRFSDRFDSEFEMKRFVNRFVNTVGGSALDKALKEAQAEFERDTRDNVKKILVVITDKRSDSAGEGVKSAAKPLVEGEVKVIPVALGVEADTSELQKTTTNKQNLIDAKDETDADALADKIMEKALEGWLL